MKISSLQKDNRGLAHVVVVVLVVVVLAAVGFAGWRVMQDKDDSGDPVASEAAKVAEDACKAEIDDKDFCKFASNWSSLGAYKSVMESSSDEGTSTLTLETDGGEKTKMTTVADGQTVAEYISIGSSTYVKDLTDGAWVKYTSEDYQTTDVSDDLDFDFNDETIPEEQRTTYKNLGKEACGDLTCFKYQIVDPTNSDDEQTLWFDDDDYKLRRWRFVVDGSTTDAAFSYESVTITEPSPIKEAASPTGVPTEEEIQQMIDAYSAE